MGFLRIFIALLIILFNSSLVYAVCPGTVTDCYTGTATEGIDTLTVIDCSYDAVNATVGAASSGDTVIVPACAVTTWSTQLTFTKSITFQGAGVGVTNIKSATGSANYLLKATLDSTNNLYITGFTFDIDSNSKGISLVGDPAREVRFHHNQVLNCKDATYPCFKTGELLYGVIDNNVFTGYPHFDLYGAGTAGITSWDTTDVEYSGNKKIYLEDNTISHDIFGTSQWAYSTIGQGGKAVWRYNNLISTNDNAAIYPVFDMHGNQTSGVYAGMVGEYYGNSIQASDIINDRDIRLFTHRGSKALMFYNLITSNTNGSHNIYNLEEYDDAVSPTTNETPQYVNDSYYWNNRKGVTSVTVNTGSNWTPEDDPNYCGDAVYPEGDCPSHLIAENTDYFMWTGTVAFDGTKQANSGMGCGTLAARPATCTTGVGYWATNQSCSDLTGMVGVSPATKINGTLYKCTETDIWTSYYTPYTYPHPLRGEVVSNFTLGSGAGMKLGTGATFKLQ